MKIYFASDSDPMLLESLEGMNSLHEKLTAVLPSSEQSMALPARPLGNPAPYQELLGGLEVVKIEGPLKLSLTPEQWRRLAGAPEHLARSISFFPFEEGEEGHHHHPEYLEVEGYMAQGAMSLMLEVDSEQA